MVKTVKLFNPKEIPFGSLSINHKDILYIDGEKYNTVTHYIYANMLKNILNKKTIQSTKVKDVKEEYMKLRISELLNLIRKAMETAIDIKISNDQELINTLLETKDAPILYITDDEWVGTGNSGKGMNLVGKYLMQKRRQLMLNFKYQTIEKKKQLREHLLYEAYVAYTLLNLEINDGNDLSIYIGKTPTNIIDMFGRKEAMDKSPPKNFIVEEFNKGRSKKELVEAIDNPESLVYVVRKNNLSILRKRQLTKKEYMVLDMYCEYTLEKNFPELPREKYTQAIQQQYAKFGWHAKLELAKKIYDLYEKGMFSERLSTNIDKVLSDIKVPSEEDIREAEAYEVDVTRIENINDFPYEKPSGEPIKIYDDITKNESKFGSFSTNDYSKFIKIDDNMYPTITHYLYTVLMANLFNIGSIKNAYTYIIADEKAPVNLKRFKDPNAIVFEYTKLKEFSDIEQLKKLAIIGLDKKLQDRLLQDVLLTTGNDIIIWNDFSDPILGSGPDKKGENLIGKYLMKLRTDISESHKNQTFHLLTENEITVFLREDPVLYAWVNMRIMDTCKTINCLKNYMYNKNKETVKINTEFVESVIDIVYQPCSHIFATSKQITAELPQWFEDAVHKCNGFEKTNSDVASIIWKRLSVMIWYLIDHLKETTIKNLRNVLFQIQSISSAEKNCIKITSSNTDNCILSAIINLLKRMVVFNKQLSFNNTIDKTDVETVVSIILNSDMKGKNEETKQELDVKTYNETEGDDDYNYPEEHDDEYDENEERDYGDEMKEEDDEFGDIYSPKNQYTLEEMLEDIPEIKDVQEVKSYVISGMENIKNYKMASSIKNNRINFFSTQL
jgi:predicted NAD-dependent protein-ADP-ribosyltransferase YbiA (DUF1768 family)